MSGIGMSEALQLLFFLALGLGAGAAHMALIAREVAALMQGGSVLAGLGMRLGRFALTIAALAWAASRGWPFLLAAALGFGLARLLLLRRAGRSLEGDA